MQFVTNPNAKHQLLYVYLCLTLSLRMDPVTSSSLRCRLNFGGMLSSGCSSRSGSLCRAGEEKSPMKLYHTVGELKTELDTWIEKIPVLVRGKELQT